ncbi:hypothetical protein [Kaistia sp. MMO-174]|uniref:hypothetical protein n=1 Tax=Kaistia sp. MMO-174 TaxID=3081256 RepID=UPI0030178E92
MIQVIVYSTDEPCHEAFRFAAHLIGPGTGAKGKPIAEMLPMVFHSATAETARASAEAWLAAERARQDKIGRDPGARRKSKASSHEGEDANAEVCD